jgi:hypothetical protein
MGKKKAGQQPPAEQPQAQNGNGGDRRPPVMELRCGRLKVVVWSNLTTEGEEWFSITLARVYQDGEGNWKTAGSFGRDDLLPLAQLVEKAWAEVCTKQGAKFSAPPPQPEAPEEIPI